MSNELGFSFVTKDEKKDEDNVLKIIVSGGLPDEGVNSIPEGPLLHIGHPAPPELAEAYSKRDAAIEQLELAHRAISEANDDIRKWEAYYTAVNQTKPTDFNLNH